MQNRLCFDALVYLYLKLCLLNIIWEEESKQSFNFWSILLSLKGIVQHIMIARIVLDARYGL